MVNDKLFVRPAKIAAPKFRLFCFPFAGGSIQTYFAWHKSLPDDVELVIVQPPGRGSRMMEKAYTSMQPVVDELMQHSDFITSVPSIFYGHSLGSRVAFELCLRLKKASLPLPIHFIGSGSRSPHLVEHKHPIFDLPHDEFIQELKDLNGTPPEVLENKELMDLLEPLLRADFQIAHEYHAEEFALDLPMHVFYGEQDVDVPIEKVEAWQSLSAYPITKVPFAGGHFFIHSHANEVIKMTLEVINLAKNKCTLNA